MKILTLLFNVLMVENIIHSENGMKLDKHIISVITRHFGQHHLPSGISLRGGSRHCRWYTLLQVSQSKSCPDWLHTPQKSSWASCQNRAFLNLFVKLHLYITSNVYTNLYVNENKPLHAAIITLLGRVIPFMLWFSVLSGVLGILLLGDRVFGGRPEIKVNI